MWLVCGLCLISLFVVCRAAPISRESSSNEGGLYFDKSREKFANDSVCVSDDVLYKENDVIPTSSMCEQCVCRPPDIICEIIKCEKKSGCRSIQSPGECCPEYRCDCEADGRIYQNGERLENPESPCRACYCQSGEIVCTVIKCYTREDCMPRYVTGMCCPKYDHCPPVDPTPLLFYTTPETLLQSTKSSSVGYEDDISETSNISQENIQDNTVDTSKWIEVLEEKSSALMYSPNTLDDYGKDISLMQTSAETTAKEKNDRDRLYKDNIEIYDESKIVEETSQTEGYYKAKQQEHNTETYTESTGTNEESTRQKYNKEGVRDNIEFYTDSTGTETTSKRESNDKLELQQDNNEVYNESTDTREMSKVEDNYKEELRQDNTETYTESAATKQTDRIEESDKKELPHNTKSDTESAGTGETRIRQGSDKEEEQEKIQVYDESKGTGEMSKTEDKNELQQDNTKVNNESTGSGETSKMEGINKETMEQEDTDFYTENKGTGQSSKIEGEGKDEVQSNTEAYTENTGTGERSGIEGNDKGEAQGNTEAYTESADTGERSKTEGNDKDEVQDNTEVSTESAGSGEKSKIERNDHEEVPDNTEVYTENADTGKRSKIEGNDKEVSDNTEVYTENTGNGKISKIEGNDKEEVHGNAEVYAASSDTGETSKREENDKEEVHDNTKVYTASTDTGETSKIEENDEEVHDNTEVYTASTDTGETSKIERNDKEEVHDNTEVYTASTDTGETRKMVGNVNEDMQDNTEVYTKNIETAETSKMEENYKEMQQDNTEIYAASTDTGEAKKAERNEKEELQQDDTEIYVESTLTGETRKREGNNTQELQEESTEVFTEGISTSVLTYTSDEDKTDILLGKIKAKVAKTWFDETTITPYHILKSEEAKNNDNLDEEVSSALATKIEDNGMVTDGGVVWYTQEARESSTETVTYETSQETKKHEITRNISEHNQSGSVTEPTLYETSLNSREGSMTGFTEGDDDTDSLIDNGEIVQGKYNEDNMESSNTEHSSTTAVPDSYTLLTVHESRDIIPVVTFQPNMELHDMDLVVPGLDNTKLQVDYGIKATEENPVIGISTEINANSEYSDVTNITHITNSSTGNDPNMSGLGDKTLQNSREESENINKDEYSTSSLAFSTASLTTNPTTDVTSELQNTERTESSEPITVKSETAFSTEIYLPWASLLMHDSSTNTQNEEITSSTVDSTTPDVLEGEHPLNTKESEQTDATVTEKLQQDVTAESSIRDSNNMQESKAVPHTSIEDMSHTAHTSESVMVSDRNTALADGTDKSVFFTSGATEASEKILGPVDAIKSNKTANTTATSDILPKEWLKTHHVTTVTNPDAVHMEEEDEDKSQSTFNHDKAEEFTSTVNYSYDESSSLHESKSGDKTDQPTENDTTNTEWATESMLKTMEIFKNTDKVDDFPPNRNDSQMSAHDFLNESQSANEQGTNNASMEMEETTGEQGISTALNYSSHEKEMPFLNNFFSQNREQHNEGEVSDNSTTDIIHHGDGALTGGAMFGGPGENEGLISDASKTSWNKQPNKFDKEYPESFSTEDKSTAFDQHGSDEPAIAKEVQSAVYSSSSYEMNSHDFYGVGDYYVSSSESGLTYNMTDVHSEVTSTVTSTSSEEQSTDLMTSRSTDNGNEGRNVQAYTDNETTMRPSESDETNRPETALESTTPVPLENVHNSTEITKTSEVNIKNSLQDNQNAVSLDGNVTIWKLEQALYESSGSHQENYST